MLQVGAEVDAGARFVRVLRTEGLQLVHEQVLEPVPVGLTDLGHPLEEANREDQKIIEIAAGECHQWNLAQFLANNGAALQRLQSGGVTVREFPDSVWDAMGTAANDVLQENMGDDLFKKIYDSAMASMRASWVHMTPFGWPVVPPVYMK